MLLHTEPGTKVKQRPSVPTASKDEPEDEEDEKDEDDEEEERGGE